MTATFGKNKVKAKSRDRFDMEKRERAGKRDLRGFIRPPNRRRVAPTENERSVESKFVGLLRPPPIPVFHCVLRSVLAT